MVRFLDGSSFRLLIVFFALVFLAFSPLLFFPFQYDDITTVQGNTLLRNFSSFPLFLQGHVDQLREMNGVYRPLFLTFLSIWGNIVAFTPAGFRAFSFLLHAISGLLFCRILIFSKISKPIAIFSTLFFLLHPIQTSDLFFVWKQSDLWVGFFFLLSTYLFITKYSPLWSLSFYVTQTLIFLLALAFKETALIFPLLWVFLDRLFPIQGRMQRHIFYALSFLLALAFYWFFIREAPQPRVFDGIRSSRWGYFATQVSNVFPEYIKVLFYPLRLSVDRAIPLLSDASFLFKFASISLFFCVLVISRLRTTPQAYYWMILGALWMVPTSSFQPLSLLYDETRLYFAVFSLGLILGLSLELLKTRFWPSAVNGSFVFLIVTLFCFSFFQSFRFESEEKLWSSNLKVDPKSARSHYQLGVLFQDERALDDAQMQYLLALEDSPHLYSAKLNLAIVYGQKGDLDKAKRVLSDLLFAPDPFPAQAAYHLGLGELYRKNDSEAQRFFELADHYNPTLYLGALGRGTLFEARGEKEKAEKELQKYILNAPILEDQKARIQKRVSKLRSR